MQMRPKPTNGATASAAVAAAAAATSPIHQCCTAAQQQRPLVDRSGKSKAAASIKQRGGADSHTHTRTHTHSHSAPEMPDPSHVPGYYKVHCGYQLSACCWPEGSADGEGDGDGAQPPTSVGV